MSVAVNPGALKGDRLIKTTAFGNLPFRTHDEKSDTPLFLYGFALIVFTDYAGNCGRRCKMDKRKLDNVRDAIEGLSLEEKKEFFSDVVPDICDSSLTIEGCRSIFEKKLSGSRYLEAIDDLEGIQAEARHAG
jgi:hypothetical protein